MFSDRGWWKWV